MKGTMKTTTKDGKGPHTKKQKQKQKTKKKKKKGTENNPHKGWRKAHAEVDLMVKIGVLAKLRTCLVKYFY